jgi:arginine/lysine/histidine transport system permease protein
MEHLMSISMYLPLLLQGLCVTLLSWIVAGIIGLSTGTLLGIVGSRYLASPITAGMIRLYTFIAKGIPAYVLILIAYFVLPALLGLDVSGFVAGCGALAFSSSGYVTEIVRAGINALPRGQWEACKVLGYSLHQTLSRIIMPQAFMTVAPALIGEVEQLLKSSSLLATIGVMDLTRSGMNIISRELNPFPVYLTIAVIYLVFSAALQLISLLIERKARRGYR